MDTRIKNKGFTLVEMMVAITIFSVIVGAAIGVFVSSMKSQRKVLAEQEILDQTSYALEYISRAIRMAKKDSGPECLSLDNLNYEKTSSGTGGIKFKTYLGDYCQEFFRECSGGKCYLVERKTEIDTGFITENNLTAPNLNVASFNIGPADTWSQDDSLQPAITIFFEIEGKENSKISIQTTISQRNLDVQY
ncbi:MAG: type II secretion system protein [Candidatus Pacebacteria bacterium]|nr:type II secretion system protein [Candidatus Paceibacterota bacterium]